MAKFCRRSAWSVQRAAHPSIPHEAGLKAPYEKLEERVEKKIPSSDLVNMVDFVWKNNYFEFDSKVKKQISGTAIGIKFAPPYARIFRW